MTLDPFVAVVTAMRCQKCKRGFVPDSMEQVSVHCPNPLCMDYPGEYLHWDVLVLNALRYHPAPHPAPHELVRHEARAMAIGHPALDHKLWVWVEQKP